MPRLQSLVDARRPVLPFAVCLLLLSGAASGLTAPPLPLSTADSTPVVLGPTTQTDATVLRKRKWTVGLFEAGFTVGSFIGLNQAWYSEYEKSGFHLFNDWDEWMQVDKAGHLLSTYHGSRLSAEMWRWAGMDRRKAAWLGSGVTMAYLTMVEVLDGFNEKWGFSLGDMAFNAAGSALFLAQDLGWGEQRIGVKFSYFPMRYDLSYAARADELFGKSDAERWLKDYNSQTYWLSLNLRSLFPESRLPPWLNLALGHNARVMLGGRENVWTDESGNTVDRSDVQRYRRILLSADIDLTRIPTRSRFLRSAFSFLNIVKIPAPALEWDTRGGFRLHGLYY